MPRISLDIPDEVFAKLESRLRSEGVSLEAKAVELLAAYADALTDRQIEIARGVMDRYDSALRKLAE